MSPHLIEQCFERFFLIALHDNARVSEEFQKSQRLFEAPVVSIQSLLWHWYRRAYPRSCIPDNQNLGLRVIVVLSLVLLVACDCLLIFTLADVFLAPVAHEHIVHAHNGCLTDSQTSTLDVLHRFCFARHAMRAPTSKWHVCDVMLQHLLSGWWTWAWQHSGSNRFIGLLNR